MRIAPSISEPNASTQANTCPDTNACPDPGAKAVRMVGVGIGVALGLGLVLVLVLLLLLLLLFLLLLLLLLFAVIVEKVYAVPDAEQVVVVDTHDTLSFIKDRDSLTAIHLLGAITARLLLDGFEFSAGRVKTRRALAFWIEFP